MFYDGSIPFFGAAHVPYVVASLLVLLSFGLIPPLLLIMASISRNLNLIGRRWPNVCRYIPTFDRCSFNNQPKLNAFLEVFHGCYKDGTNTPRGFDYRWCAGFYLILRAALYAVYAFNPDWSSQYSLLQLLFTMGMLIFSIFCPYKDDFYNNLDTTMFALMLAVNILTTYNYTITVIGSQLSLFTFIVQYILVLLPLFYISVVVLKHLCRYFKRWKCCGYGLFNDQQRESLLYCNNDESSDQSA